MFVLVVLSFDEKGTVRKPIVLTEGGGLVISGGGLCRFRTVRRGNCSLGVLGGLALCVFGALYFSEHFGNHKPKK